MPFDYVIAGGGLQAGLLVMALRQDQPTATIALVERADRLGGNHTWSFHQADVPPRGWPVIGPLVAASWPGYRVRFPGLARTIPTAYHSILPEQFDRVVRHAVIASGGEVRLESEVVAVTADRVTLATGEDLVGRCVIDARGTADAPARCGWQIFLGLEVALAAPWPDELPLVMDATVPQINGYRFVYVLPLTPDRVLVEETYFSDLPLLDRDLLRKRVEQYLTQSGVSDWQVIREESGVLPMPWAGRGPQAELPLRAGTAGGWFHPATGYTVPVALKLALAVAGAAPEAATDAARQLADRLRWRVRFAQFLNRLLFRLVRPEGRWRVFARLYRSLADARLARFYALEFTRFDAIRMVVGRPPPIDFGVGRGHSGLSPAPHRGRPWTRGEVAPCPPRSS